MKLDLAFLLKEYHAEFIRAVAAGMIMFGVELLIKTTYLKGETP